MTTDEYIAKQRRAFAQIIEKDAPLRIAARDTMAKQATRIFVEGKNSQESLIGGGAYDDNHELYVNPNTSPGKKFKPAGKPFEFGKTKGGKIKTVRDTRGKTRWFPSYKAYRETIGRKTEKVDLFLSGDLKSDFSNSGSKKPNGNVKPRKVNTHEFVSGFSREINALKAEGMEEKYNDPIFSPSKVEKENFFNVAGKEFKRILINA